MLKSSDRHRGFVLLAVNIPSSFAGRRRQSYTPDAFKEEVIRRIRDSNPLKQLATRQVPGEGRGNWCVAIKKICGDKVETVEVHSSVPALRFP